MTLTRILKSVGVAVLVANALTGVINPRSTLAQGSSADNEQMLIQIGFRIAPVPLSLAGKDQDLVGLGSFLVNAVADCNGCHTAGVPPNFNYTAGGNPYFDEKAKVDSSTYLAGGMDFGPVGTPTGPNMYAGPNIITRNLTPDRHGRPEGGHSLADFKQIIRNGTDFDHIHPTCTAAQVAQIQQGQTPVCIPTSPGNTPDGDLLQIMPWPTFSNMTDHDLDAIYEYLSAIPCIDNTMSPPPAGAPNEFRNDCGTSSVVIPKADNDGRKSGQRR